MSRRTVADVMTTQVMNVQPQASCKNIAAVMVTHDVSALPVVATDQGIATLSDTRRRTRRGSA